MRTNVKDEVADETRELLDQDSQLQEEIAELQSLLSLGRVTEARSLALEMEQRWPESDLARRYARVLAPPVVRAGNGKPAPTREQTREQSAWIQQNAAAYAGCWVILRGDELLAAHPRLRAAIEEADRRAGPDAGSIYFL